MISCLIDYVGVLHCGNTVPDSGQYINSLPGIRLSRLDKIADDEQVTFLGVWADIQNEAGSRFYGDVIEALNKCYQLQPYCDYDDLICQNKSKLLKAWKYLLGNQLMLENIYSDRINKYTLIKKEEARELADHYSVEYEKSLAQAVKFMNVADCELCCQDNPNVTTWLP